MNPNIEILDNSSIEELKALRNELVPLKQAAELLFYKPITLYTKLLDPTFPLTKRKIGQHVFLLRSEIQAVLSGEIRI